MQTQVRPCLSIIGHYDRIQTKVDLVNKKNANYPFGLHFYVYEQIKSEQTIQTQMKLLTKQKNFRWLVYHGCFDPWKNPVAADLG